MQRFEGLRFGGLGFWVLARVYGFTGLFIVVSNLGCQDLELRILGGFGVRWGFRGIRVFGSGSNLAFWDAAVYW